MPGRHKRAKGLLGPLETEWTTSSVARSSVSPVAEDVCHKCKGTGHWARECPQNKVGVQPASVLNEQATVCCAAGTVNAVRGGSALTGANAVPISSAKA